MDKRREEKIREEIRKKLEQEFRQKEKRKNEKTEFDKDELILREKIRKEEEERFYRQKGLVRYKNKYGEVEWLTPEEAQKRYNSRKKKKKSFRKKWKVIRGRFLEYVVFFFLLFAVYAFYKYFQKKATPVKTVQKIEIQSNVHGAYIFMNGNFQNLYSPAVLTGVSRGTHLIQLFKPGYVAEPPFIRVKVGPNESHTLYFNLIPYKKTYKMEMPEDLREATIYVDGLPVKNGNNQIELTEGIHLLYFEHPDWIMQPDRFWVNVTENTVFSQKYRIEKRTKPAYISVTSSVPDAALFLNDKLWGIQPNGILHPVEAGSYKLNAYYPNLSFSPGEFIFELKPGEKKQLILSPKTKDLQPLVRCKILFPGNGYILLDGKPLPSLRQNELNLITGDHIFTVLDKTLNSVIYQKIFIGGTDFLILEWNPEQKRFFKKGGEAN